MSPWIPGLVFGLALTACGGDRSPPAADTVQPPTEADLSTRAENAPLADLVDPNIPPAVAGEDGWNFHESAEVDLSMDGRAERIVLTARVEMYRGQPAWDDGQPWQVYVEDPTGRRTYLYAQRIQLGTLAMRVTRPESGAPPAILLIEHIPDRLRILEASFAGEGRTSVSALLDRKLDPSSSVNMSMPR